MRKTSKKPVQRKDRQHRLQTSTIKLINKLDRTKKKFINKKIFDLLGELEARRRTEDEQKGKPYVTAQSAIPAERRIITK